MPADVAVRPQWAAHYCAAGAGSAPWQTGGFKDADARERDDSGGEVHPPRAFAGCHKGGNNRCLNDRQTWRQTSAPEWKPDK